MIFPLLILAGVLRFATNIEAVELAPNEPPGVTELQVFVPGASVTRDGSSALTVVVMINRKQNAPALHQMAYFSLHKAMAEFDGLERLVSRVRWREEENDARPFPPALMLVYHNKSFDKPMFLLREGFEVYPVLAEVAPGATSFVEISIPFTHVADGVVELQASLIVDDVRVARSLPIDIQIKGK